MKLFTILYTLFARLLLLIVVVVFFIPAMIFLLLPARIRFSSKLGYKLIHVLYWLIQKCSLLPITYVYEGELPDKPVIFAANHQSSLDIPLLGLLANTKPHIWLATNFLLKTVFLRFIVKRLTVIVDIATPRRAMRSLLQVLSLVQNQDKHVMIFPEGGRYTTGMVNDFYGGFVILARKLQRPVVPVCIIGVDKVYPPGSLFIHYHPVKVIVGKPMYFEADESDALFKARVHQWFIDHMNGVNNK